MSKPKDSYLAPPGPVRMPGKAKPKAKGTSPISKPRKSAAKSKSPPIEGAVLAGMRSRERATGKPASRLIDQRIRDLGGWRGATLARMRALILEADPEMTEEWKWMGTPVWSHHGMVCTGEAYTKVVKLTFARGPGSQTHRASSTPAWKAPREGRSTSTKGRGSTRARSGRS